ncbi:PREDICTED: galactose-3-O-sulfotransferase 2-like, partial [Tauraco erythrolophus]|uniref:galactose-3-O-sulfotransferase 2-like n=1 Tax=Tauraco erythrolophus TaxID=121530 RepID=UPI000523B8C8
KLKAIYRCQPGRLWVFFSLLIFLLVTLQVVEKLQPPRSCRCELERALQPTVDHVQEKLSYALQTPDPLRQDDHRGARENITTRNETGGAQPPQAEGFYQTNLERGFFPSWTEVSKAEEGTPGEGQQARGVSSPGETCEPKTDIVFLKVHKSASSTVMNILFRFGEMHNLTFAFPIGGGNQLFYPHHFLARFVQGFSSRNPRRFNILCHHMRFLQPEVEKVVSSSAVYFSILRNPVQLMESSFSYYKGTSAFSHARSLEEFLSQPYHYYNPAFSAERVQLMLKAIEASFDLLLISEYFDESMVLLKEMLCWDLDSIVSFPLNIRDSSTKSRLSDSIVKKIKDWNRLDWEIYTHFNRTFWERIDRDIGRERMRREVQALRERRAELARTCLQGMGSVAPKDIKDSSLRPLQHGNAKILGYNIKQGLDKETERMCRRLVTPELQYSSTLYKKQFPPKPPKTHQPSPSWKGNVLRHRLGGTQN